jgi:trypsin
MSRKLVRVMLAVAIAVAIAVPAGAITFGQLDGNGHPNVGALIVDIDGELFLICSGTLVSPSVFVTAGHCTTGFDEAWVSFDPQPDPTNAAGLHHGMAFTHPQFGAGGNDDPNDVGVVVLDAQATGITPASLPTANQLGLMSKSSLRAATFVTVGYGLARQDKSGGPHSLFDDGQRRVATQSYNSLLKAWLTLSMNPSTGSGGTCFGDSGGPHFLGVTVVAVTNTGDRFCRAQDKTYRLDTPQARSFLSGFVSLP